jgi:hypothetical protein
MDNLLKDHRWPTSPIREASLKKAGYRSYRGAPGINLIAGVFNNYRLLYSITEERKREEEHFSALLK